MKLAISGHWYAGADDNTGPYYQGFFGYLGALRQRTLVRNLVSSEQWAEMNAKLPLLSEGYIDPKGLAEPTEDDYEKLGQLEVGMINRSRLSMVGKAREMVVEGAQEWGADYLLAWDSDMLFPISGFLQLWRNQKLVCAALAFTARHPIHPVIYRMKSHQDPQGFEVIDGSDIVLDYPRDTLISDEIIGGPLAFGAGMVLFDMKVFRELPQPWFNSTGCGEDWFFCHRCSKHGIPRYMDTSVKTMHKEHMPRWACEETYWMERHAARQTYVDLFGNGVSEVKADSDGTLWPVTGAGRIAK
jgi:hypothetical protein